jgi:Tfp pilus assembly protein PilO
MDMIDRKQMNNLNLFLNRYFNIFLAGLIILILVGAYFILLRPKFQDTMAIIQQSLEEQQKLYLGQQKKLVNLQAINAVYKGINEEDLKKFDVILPDNYPSEALFGEIAEIITQSGFIISTVSFSREEAALGTVGRLNINLSMNAVDYSGLKSLLRKLENNLRLFDIQDISFSPGDETVSLTIVTYYYKK